MKEIKNKAFLVYFNEENIYRELTDAQAGKLFKAMFRYSVDGQEVITRQDDPMLWGVFLGWRVQYDQDNAKYMEQAMKKRERDLANYYKKKNAQSIEEDEEDVSGDENSYINTGDNSSLQEIADALAEKYGGWYEIYKNEAKQISYFNEVKEKYGSSQTEKILDYYLNTVINTLPF